MWGRRGRGVGIRQLLWYYRTMLAKNEKDTFYGLFFKVSVCPQLVVIWKLGICPAIVDPPPGYWEGGEWRGGGECDILPFLPFLFLILNVHIFIPPPRHYIAWWRHGKTAVKDRSTGCEGNYQMFWRKCLGQVNHKGGPSIGGGGRKQVKMSGQKVCTLREKTTWLFFCVCNRDIRSS